MMDSTHDWFVSLMSEYNHILSLKVLNFTTKEGLENYRKCHQMKYALTKCTYVERHKPEHVYIFTGPCIVTGKKYSVEVPAEGLFEYRQGRKMLQECFPHMAAGDREFLMTGYSPEGWDQAFGCCE